MSVENPIFEQPELFTEITNVALPLVEQIKPIQPSIAERTDFDPNSRRLEGLEVSGAGGGISAAVAGELLNFDYPVKDTSTAKAISIKATKVARRLVELPTRGHNNSPKPSRPLTTGEAERLKTTSQLPFKEMKKILYPESGNDTGSGIGR